MIDPELLQHKNKFESLIQKTSGCFYWNGKVDKRTGRGKFSAGKKYKNVTALAWEYAYNTTIPEGFTVKQICYTNLCVRPDHLELVRRTFPWRS